MHIEPGIVHGAKMVLAYGTAAAAAGYSLKHIARDLKTRALPSFVARAGLATAGALVFFELLPHFSAGVSEVHFILGTTLLLLLGVGPAAVGLAAGLGIQSMFFAPTDMPMYFVNITTLLVPLYAMSLLAAKIIPAKTAYKDVKYSQALALSTAYQGGIVAWVAFWAFYGHGFGAENLAQVASFGAAYMTVILLEPLVDLGGFIPCPDHRIPPDAEFDLVCYYCEQIRHHFS